jgi:hypothetical protein
MKLNPEKCKDMTIDFLQYTGSNATAWQPMVTDGTQIKVVTVLKLLGVYLSSDLTWSSHCDYIIKKWHSRLYALRKLKKMRVCGADIVTVYTVLSLDQ